MPCDATATDGREQPMLALAHFEPSPAKGLLILVVVVVAVLIARRRPSRCHGCGRVFCRACGRER